MPVFLRVTFCLVVFIVYMVGSFVFAQSALLAPALRQIESHDRVEIGLFALNTNDGEQLGYRAHQRFPLCSTAKLMVVAAILKKSQSRPSLLQQHIAYTQHDVASAGYAPITQQHLLHGMRVDQLCAAALSVSDNAASNLLVRLLGGPKQVTAFSRSLGDRTFRLDRYEPRLNTAIPGDLRDTASPQSMVDLLQQLMLGPALQYRQRHLLMSWLQHNTTGARRIRAGTPVDWLVGDKTGTGEYGATSDVAVIWPPHRKPIVMAIYLTQSNKTAQPQEKLIAVLSKKIIDVLCHRDLDINCG